MLAFFPLLVFSQTKDSLQLAAKLTPVKHLVIESVPVEWLSSVGYREGKQKNALAAKQLIEQLLDYAQQNGYPFASVKIDSLLADSQGLQLKAVMNMGQLILFDTVDFGGTANLKKSYLYRYLGIYPGMPYSEKLVKTADARISELAYVSVTRPAGVYFAGNLAKPYLYLDNKKASSFDGVLGLAPNSALNNKLVLTGDINLKLVNLGGSGKSLEFSYRAFLSGSQDLQLRFQWPYFLKTRLGLDYTFKLMRFDSTYLEIFNDIALQYRFTANNLVKVFYQQQQVNVLAPDTNYVRQTGALPAFTDVRVNYYGVGFRRSFLNYGLNPRKGYVIEGDGAAGNRKVLVNESIKAISLTNAEGQTYSVYDSTQLNSLQYKLTIKGSLYTPISKNWVWLLQGYGGLVYNKQLFLNELFRIGGLKTLKGFDEQSIFADAYGITNMELRYLFQKNSNFLIFWNGAWYRNNALDRPVTDTPWGFGAGMNLETGAGILSMYYALGSEKGNSIQWRSAKIHFGLINFF